MPYALRALLAVFALLVSGCGGGEAPEPPIATAVTQLRVQDVVRDEKLMGLDISWRGKLDPAAVKALQAHSAIAGVDRRMDEASGTMRVDVRANHGDLARLILYTDPKSDDVLGYYCELRSPARKPRRPGPDAWGERCRRQFEMRPLGFFGTVDSQGPTLVFDTDLPRRYAAVRDRRLVGFLVATADFFRPDCHGFQSRAEILADAKRRIEEKRPRENPLIDYEIAGVELKEVGRQLAALRKTIAKERHREQQREGAKRWEAFLAEVRDEPFDVKMQRYADAYGRLPTSGRFAVDRALRADARRELEATDVGVARRSMLSSLAKSGYLSRAKTLLAYANTIDGSPNLEALGAWYANRDPRANKRFAQRVNQAVRLRALHLLAAERKALANRTGGATYTALGAVRRALNARRTTVTLDLRATERWLETCRAFDTLTDPFERVAAAPWLTAPTKAVGERVARAVCPALKRQLVERAGAAAEAGRKATAAACWLAAAVAGRDTWPTATTGEQLIGKRATPDDPLAQARHALLIESLQFVPTPDDGARDLDPVLIDGAALEWPIVSKLGIAYSPSARRRKAINEIGGRTDKVTRLLRRNGRVAWVDILRSTPDERLPGTPVQFLAPTRDALSAKSRRESDALNRESEALRARAKELEDLPPTKDSNEFARRWKMREEFAKRQQRYNERTAEWADAAAKELAPRYARVRYARRTVLDDYVDTSLLVYSRQVGRSLGGGEANEREVAWMRWFFGRSTPGFEGLPIERGDNPNTRMRRCDRLEREALEQPGRAEMGRAIARFWDAAEACDLPRRAPRTRKLLDQYRTTFTAAHVLEHVVKAAKHGKTLEAEVLSKDERQELERSEQRKKTRRR